MEELMAKILAGEASDHEKLNFYEQMDVDPALKKEFIRYKSLYIAYTAKSYINIEVSKQRQVDKIMYKLARRNIFKRFKLVASYAAVFITAVILMHLVVKKSSFYNSNTSQFAYIKTEAQSKNSVKLADGSTIWLNANSVLEVESESKRQVVLNLTGEALFDIVHDENRKFIVNAGEFRIVDVGTKFNVKSHAQDPYIHAALIEGRIDVYTKEDEVYSLKPGQEFVYSKGVAEINTFDIDNSAIGNWMSSKFMFRNTKLVDVAEELEQWYGVTVKFESEIAKNIHFTGNLDKSISLESMMQMIDYLTPVKYKIMIDKNNKTSVIIK